MLSVKGLITKLISLVLRKIYLLEQENNEKNKNSQKILSSGLWVQFFN